MSQNRPKNYAVRLHDGHKKSTTLNVYEWQGSGPPLLLVHAAGFHARVWDKVIAQLGDRHVYAVDLRNHGLSDNSAPPYSFQLFGDDLVALIEALDLSDITACGHSMGGHVVLQAASSLPHRFKHILLLDPVIFTPDSPDPIETDPAKSPIAARRNEWASADEMFTRFCSLSPFSEWDPQVLRDYCEYGLLPKSESGLFELACPPLCEAAIYQSSGNGLLLEQLSSITATVKILRVKERTKDDAPFDFRPSATFKGLVGLIPGATENYLPQHTHFIPMEDPNLVTKEIDTLPR
ncbi:alpha/beta hydrolase [Paraglaciecola chathamensis]|uniref:Alpha/beta hydrolase fold n=1 Tax=Paraglaciecola chathamensis S18K6 TaxID=1127672 RepID=A0AAV3V244_9ALTE|nr:alpha/beta hydrolase [Paraglaciecola chathamensis]GAC11017.1 alpha/beta hydrolase fold [Paraglaciecola chathamensis S18K6]